MTELQFKLESFEGPLDLLLHLVTKHKLNIYDIEISLLLEQYLEYIDNAEIKDYEQAADFLEMAARLIYIKTCYLLPQPEEAEELKKELQGRMIEYSLCKLAAGKLREGYAGGLVFVRKPVKLPVNKLYTRLHDKQELYDAYRAIASKVKEYTPLRADMFSPIVSKKVVSVESKITDILQRLYLTGTFEMAHLYDGMEDRSERIAAFLAVLELTKSGRIFLNEDNTLIELKTASDDPEDNTPPETEPEDTAPIEAPAEPEPAPAEVPAEPETALQEPHVPEPPKTYTVRLTKQSFTVKLYDEPELSPAPEREAIPASVPIAEPASEPEKPSEPEPSPAPERVAVPASAPIAEPAPEPEKPSEPEPSPAPESKAVPASAPIAEPAPEDNEELALLRQLADMPEPLRAERANLYGTRYYWGAPNTRNYALLHKLRI